MAKLKRIGKLQRAPSGRGSPRRSYNAAKIVDDTIAFHGAKLRVQVHHHYQSKIFGHGITVAAGRGVTLREGAVEVRIDERRIQVRLRKHRGGPPSAALVGELSKKDRARIPMLIEFDDQDRFEGVIIFPPATPAKKPPRKTDPTKRFAKTKRRVVAKRAGLLKRLAVADTAKE